MSLQLQSWDLSGIFYSATKLDSSNAENLGVTIFVVLLTVQHGIIFGSILETIIGHRRSRQTKQQPAATNAKAGCFASNGKDSLLAHT